MHLKACAVEPSVTINRPPLRTHDDSMFLAKHPHESSFYEYRYLFRENKAPSHVSASTRDSFGWTSQITMTCLRCHQAWISTCVVNTVCDHSKETPTSLWYPIGTLKFAGSNWSQRRHQLSENSKQSFKKIQERKTLAFFLEIVELHLRPANQMVLITRNFLSTARNVLFHLRSVQ